MVYGRWPAVLELRKIGPNSADNPKGSVMPDFAAVLKDGVSALRQKREPTKTGMRSARRAACVDRPGVNVRAGSSVVAAHDNYPLSDKRPAGTALPLPSAVGA